jgi:L-glyceraldehyde 3-phosphate reductase
MTSLVIGASSVDQLETNLSSLDNLALTVDELTAIDEYATDADINLWAASSNA